MATRKQSPQSQDHHDPIEQVDQLLEQARSILLSDKTGKLRSAQPIEQKLDRIFELQGTENEVARDIDQMVEKLLMQRDTLVKPIAEERKKLETEVKAECIERAETVAGKYLQVVFNSGTRSANLDGLEDYAKTHPDVLNFIKKSAPSASIKLIKKEKKA